LRLPGGTRRNHRERDGSSCEETGRRSLGRAGHRRAAGFRRTFQAHTAEIILMGVEDPLCGIQATNESVDPTEIARMALAEALFLRTYTG